MRYLASKPIKKKGEIILNKNEKQGTPVRIDLQQGFNLYCLFNYKLHWGYEQWKSAIKNAVFLTISYIEDVNNEKVQLKMLSKLILQNLIKNWYFFVGLFIKLYYQFSLLEEFLKGKLPIEN